MARAAASPATKRQEFHRDSEIQTLWNAVVALQGELDALYTKMDADAGITDANWATTLQTAARPALPTLFQG